MQSPASSSPIVADIGAPANSSELAMTPGSAGGNGGSPLLFSPSPSSIAVAREGGGGIGSIGEGGRASSISLSPRLKMSQQDLRKMYAHQQMKNRQEDTSDIEELSMCGVGIIIKRQPRREEGGEDGDELVVAAVPEGASADLDGSIKQGDIITSIAGVSTKGLDDCLLRALVLGCEGTEVAFSFERRGEGAGAYTIRLRRRRSRGMSAIWDGHAALCAEGDATLRVDRDATLEQGQHDSAAQEEGGVIDPPPRGMSRTPDSERKVLVDADAAVIGDAGGGMITDGGKGKDALDGGGGGGGGGGGDDDSAWLDVEGLKRDLFSACENLEEMTSERDALRRTLEGAAMAFKEAAKEEMEEAIQAKRAVEEERDRLVIERDAVSRERDAAVAEASAFRSLAEAAEERITAWGRAASSRDEAEIAKEEESRKVQSLVAKLESENEELKLIEEDFGKDRRQTSTLVQEMEEKIRELTKRLTRADARGNELWEEVQEMQRKEAGWDGAVKDALDKAKVAEATLDKEREESELMVSRARQEAEDMLKEGLKEAELAIIMVREEAEENRRKEVEEALAKGRKEAEDGLLSELTSAREVGEKLELERGKARALHKSMICESEKLDLAQSQLKDAEEKAAEAQNLKTSMDEMLSNARTELSDAQSQAVETNHRYLSEVEAHKATRVGNEREREREKEEIEKEREKENEEMEKERANMRIILDQERKRSVEAEKRSSEAVERMGDALSLMDEAVSRSTMLEAKLGDATRRATEAEDRACKFEERFLEAARRANDAEARRSNIDESVGDWSVRSPAKSPKRGGGGIAAEEGGRAERRAWHDARLKALDAEESAEAFRNRAEEAEAGLKALTGEISRLNSTISVQEEALKVLDSESKELKALRELLAMRDGEVAKARVQEEQHRKREGEHKEEVERARAEGFAAAQSGFNRMQEEVDQLRMDNAEASARIRQLMEERDRLMREQERMHKEKLRRDAAVDDNAAAAAVVSRRLTAASAENEVLSRSVSILTGEKQDLEARLDAMAQTLKYFQGSEAQKLPRGKREEAHNKGKRGGRRSSREDDSDDEFRRGGGRHSGSYRGKSNHGPDMQTSGGNGGNGNGNGGGGAGVVGNGGVGDKRWYSARQRGSIDGRDDGRKVASPTNSTSDIKQRFGGFVIPPKGQLLVPLYSSGAGGEVDPDEFDDRRLDSGYSESPRPPPRRSTASPLPIDPRMEGTAPRMEAKSPVTGMDYMGGVDDSEQLSRARASLKSNASSRGSHSNYLDPPQPISAQTSWEQQHHQQHHHYHHHHLQHNGGQRREDQLDRQRMSPSLHRPPVSREPSGGGAFGHITSDFIVVASSGVQIPMTRTPFCNPLTVRGRVVACEMERTATGGWLIMDYAADVAGQIALVWPTSSGSMSHSLSRCVTVSKAGALAVILVASSRDQDAFLDLFEEDDTTLGDKFTPRLFPCGIVSEDDASVISGQTVRMIFGEDS